jgi:hypothetical protein
VQQQRASKEDRLDAHLGAPRAQAPVRHGQNRSTPVDLGISSTVASAILLAWGIKNLDTVSPWDPQKIT